MSEESNAIVPEPEAPAHAETASAETASAETDGDEAAGTQPGSEIADAPAPEPGRLSRALPAWVRRRPLIAGLGAGILVAAVIAAVVLVLLPPASQQPEYASLPEPCSMVPLSTLAKYLPGATGTPESIPVNGPLVAGSCKWSSTTGGKDRTLIAQAYIFHSSSAIKTAQLFYNSVVSTIGCHCKGVAVTASSVADLGDQAKGLFVNVGPDADFVSAPNAAFPGADLIVRSSNAILVLNFDTTATATEASLAPSADAAQLTGMISTAHSILAALARPATVSSAPAVIAHVSPEPHYAGQRDPCRLITAATLAKYAPGATVTPTSTPSASGTPSGSPQMSSCSWGSGSTFVLLNLSVFPDAVSARQSYGVDVESFSQNVSGVTVTGVQWLPGLGEEATATFQTRSGTDGVELIVWSGNVELEYWFTGVSSTGSGPARPDRAALLAGGIAMARDGLAALARPAASSFPQGPRYASPHNPCTLVKASTLARYTPGATVQQIPEPGTVDGPQLSNCAWSAPSGSLFLSLTIYADPDSAQGGFEFGVQTAHQGQTDTTFNGAQSVRGLGEQATAIFQTVMGNSPAVALYVWSGNANIEMSITNVPFSTPLSRAAMLAADIAMARDVLADLRRS